MSERDLLLLFMLEENEDEEILIEHMKRKKRAEVHPIFKTRRLEGFFNILVNRHLSQDDSTFRDYFRLNITQFNFVLDLIKDRLQVGSSRRYPYPITPEEKLALTLRFMATGDSFHSLEFAFKISYSYISKIVETTLSVLEEKLKPIFLPPLTQEDLKKKAEEFEQWCHFPNCVGAINGKHVRISCLPKSKSGSLYHNDKNFFSSVLLAVVDANYKFIFIDVGSYGKEGDSRIFEKSELGRKFFRGDLFPTPKNLPNSDIVLPHVFVGDEAFRLHTNMMKPFSQTVACSNSEKAIFNYRLSRARRVSENAFGLKSQIFSVFYTPIALKPETTDKLIVVACCLHNLLTDAFLEADKKPFYQLDEAVTPPCENLIPLGKVGGFANTDGFVVRDTFTKYFNSPAGAVK